MIGTANFRRALSRGLRISYEPYVFQIARFLPTIRTFACPRRRSQVPMRPPRLVEFLNEQIPRVEVLAVEIRQDRTDSSKSGALVPQLRRLYKMPR
jgi:hypothetical protein